MVSADSPLGLVTSKSVVGQPNRYKGYPLLLHDLIMVSLFCHLSWFCNTLLISSKSRNREDNPAARIRLGDKLLTITNAGLVACGDIIMEQDYPISWDKTKPGLRHTSWATFSVVWTPRTPRPSESRGMTTTTVKIETPQNRVWGCNGSSFSSNYSLLVDFVPMTGFSWPLLTKWYRLWCNTVDTNGNISHNIYKTLQHARQFIQETIHAGKFLFIMSPQTFAYIVISSLSQKYITTACNGWMMAINLMAW